MAVANRIVSDTELEGLKDRLGNQLARYTELQGQGTAVFEAMYNMSAELVDAENNTAGFYLLSLTHLYQSVLENISHVTDLVHFFNFWMFNDQNPVILGNIHSRLQGMAETLKEKTEMLSAGGESIKPQLFHQHQEQLDAMVGQLSLFNEVLADTTAAVSHCFDTAARKGLLR